MKIGGEKQMKCESGTERMGKGWKNGLSEQLRKVDFVEINLAITSRWQK